MTQTPELSVVVPVYNEENRIKHGLKEILKYLDGKKYSWELVIVDDGSSDQTITLARNILVKIKNARVLASQHVGKGGAIKKGVLNSKGKWVIFLDIDLATPMNQLEKFMDIREKFDIIIGSRKIKGARILVHQPKFREAGGRIFTFLTNLLLTKDISDITCGFKLFRGQVAKKLFRQSLLTGWSFDAEVLFLAQKTGARIKEMPVSWRDDPQTRVNLLRDTVESFLGLIKIRLNQFQGKYDLL